MGISVQSLLGKPLLYNNQEIGTISAVLFFTETGKFAGVQTHTRKFFAGEHIFFQDTKTETYSDESSPRQGENWLEFAAKTAKGDSLGMISDIQFVPDLKIMSALTVTQKFLFVPISRRIFSFERIIDVRKRTVVFDCDTTLQEKLATINGAGGKMSAVQKSCYTPSQKIPTTKHHKPSGCCCE